MRFVVNRGERRFYIVAPNKSLATRMMEIFSPKTRNKELQRIPEDISVETNPDIPYILVTYVDPHPASGGQVLFSLEEINSLLRNSNLREVVIKEV